MAFIKPTVVKIRYDSLALAEEKFNKREIASALKRVGYNPSPEEYNKNADCLWLLLDALDCAPLNRVMKVKAQLAMRFSNGQVLRKRLQFTELGLVYNGHNGLKEEL